MRHIVVMVGVLALVSAAVRAQGPQGPQAPGRGQGAGPRVTGDAPHDPAPGLTMAKPTISAKGAQTIIDAIVNSAASQHQAVAIAIVDDGGNLVAFKRMDGASLGTIQATMAKSVSALRLQAPTSNFGQIAQTNLPLALGFSSAGFTILGGGQPIRASGEVVGAIAVSGGAGGSDDAFIKIGLDAFKP